MIDLMLVLAGIFHFTMVPVSLAVPRVLGWKKELEPLSPFTRLIVWVHGGYIVGTVIGLGILTLVAKNLMISGEPTGAALAGFIGLFWGARLVIQLGFYKPEYWPKGKWVAVGKLALTALFSFWTALYLTVAIFRMVSP